MARQDERKTKVQPVNVRGDLVGDDEAVALGVDDDRTTALATMILGALMTVLSIVVIVQATRLDNRGNAVGAATVPWILGGALLIVGVLLTTRGRRDMGFWEASDHTTGQDWKRLGILVVSLIVFAVVSPYLGYVVAGALLYAVTAIVLGAPDRGRALAYGFTVAALVFLLFDVGIGITLPAGPWGF